MYTKQLLINLLKDNTVRISFLKKDGTRRDIFCTLNSKLIPEKEKETRKKLVSENVLPVYDLENKGWRSFHVENITNLYIDNIK